MYDMDICEGQRLTYQGVCSLFSIGWALGMGLKLSAFDFCYHQFFFHKCFVKQESRMLTMAFNLALGKQRYVGLYGSEASLVHIVSSRPPGLQELGKRGSLVSVGLRPPWFT